MGLGLRGLGLSSVMNSVGSALNGLTGVTNQTEKTYKQQMDAMAVQNAYNKYMWNLQNEYNSPASQLARMQEAGIDINPTSYALGTGNLSNTAVHVGSAGGFAGNGSPAGNPITMATGVASSIAGIQNTVANTEATDLRREIEEYNYNWYKDHGQPVGGEPQSSMVHQGVDALGDLVAGAVDKITAPRSPDEIKAFNALKQKIKEKKDAFSKWYHGK